MAGILQEIDAVLTQQSLQKLGQDLERASQLVGQGLAKSATSAAQNFAKNLVTTLQQRFAAESAVLAKQLSDGILSPTEYATKAQRLGASIIRDLNKGIQAGEALKLFELEGGGALRTQLTDVSVALKETASGAQKAEQAIHPMAAAMGASVSGTARMNEGFRMAAQQATAVAATAPKAVVGTNAMRGALVSLASQAAGIPGPLGRIIGVLLQFAGGSALVIGLAAGIGVIALAWNKLTEATRKARKETEDYVKAAREAVKTGKTPFGQYIAEAQELEKHLRRLGDEFGAIERGQQIGGASIGHLVPTTKRQQEIIQEIQDLNARLAQLNGEWQKQEQEAVAEVLEEADQAAEELANKRKALLSELTGVLTAATLTATDELRARMDELQARFEELGENIPASLREKFNQGMQALQDQLEGETVIEAFAERLRDINVSVVEGLGSAALQNIIGELDTLRAEIDKTLAVMPQGPARIQLEEQRNAIVARRNELQREATTLAGDENLIVHDTVEERKEEVRTHEQIIQALREQARIIEQSAQAALQLAAAFGILDENAARGLQNIVQIGANLPGALAGDPTSILAVAGGLAEGISTGFGIIKKSKDPERLATNQKLYDAAMAGDEGALDKLLDRSGRGGSTGLATRKAKDDAWAKYQQARSAQEAAAAPALEAAAASEAARAAEEAERAAEQAERDRLDELRESEERQVKAREEREADIAFKDMLDRAKTLGPEIVAIVEAAIAEERAADTLAGGELGEDSPLARDARRRAEEKRREAEQAVEEAEREKQKAGEGELTAGYTVSRTITESSAGRMIGEQITTNVWLERIWEQGERNGAPARSGVPGDGGIIPLDIQVNLDGESVGRITGQHQYRRTQNRAILAGNAALPG